jgi:hypothetical protein
MPLKRPRTPYLFRRSYRFTEPRNIEPLRLPLSNKRAWRSFAGASRERSGPSPEETSFASSSLRDVQNPLPLTTAALSCSCETCTTSARRIRLTSPFDRLRVTRRERCEYIRPALGAGTSLYCATCEQVSSHFGSRLRHSKCCPRVVWVPLYRRSGAGDLAFLYWRSAVYRFHCPDRRQRCSLGNEERTFKGALRAARPPISQDRPASGLELALRGARRVPFGDRGPACRDVRESARSGPVLRRRGRQLKCTRAPVRAHPKSAARLDAHLARRWCRPRDRRAAYFRVKSVR